MNKATKWLDWLLAALIGLAVCLWAVGPRVLQATNYNWLMEGDAGSQLIAWYFYRWNVWRFPLTYFNNFMSPVGTTIVQIDSIPLLALFFKAFSRFLPETFHYFGIWYLTCYILQAICAFRIFALFSTDRISRWLGTLLLTASPILIGRFGHAALCAQWIFLYYLGLILSEKRKLPWKFLLFLNCFLIGVHAYLAAMSLAITSCLYIHGFIAAEKKEKGFLFVKGFVTCVASGLTAFVLGYFGIKDPQAEDILSFNIDLLGFFNSAGHSGVIPKLFPANFEGFAYLGLGGLVGLGISVRCLMKRESRVRIFEKEAFRRYALYYFLCILFLLFSFSPIVRLFDRPLINLSSPYSALGRWPNIFRACGRFSWPFWYTLVTLIALTPIRAFTVQRARWVLFLLVCLQVVEFMGWTHRIRSSPKKPIYALNDPGMSAKTIYLIPPFLPAAPNDCGLKSGFDERTYLRIGLYAALHHLNYNSGFTGRPQIKELDQACRDQMKAWSSGHLDPMGLYFVSQKIVPPSDALCLKSEGLILCRTNLARSFATTVWRCDETF